jgi:hypothetical protein
MLLEMLLKSKLVISVGEQIKFIAVVAITRDDVLGSCYLFIARLVNEM